MAYTANKTDGRKGRRSEDKTETGKSSAAKADAALSFTMVAGVLGLGIALLEQEAAAAGADSALNFSLDEGELSDFSLAASQTILGAEQSTATEDPASNGLGTATEASAHEEASLVTAPVGAVQHAEIDVAMAATPSHTSFTAGASQSSSGVSQSVSSITASGRLIDNPEIELPDLGNMLDAIGGIDHGFLGGRDDLNIIPNTVDGVVEVVDDLPRGNNGTGDAGSEPVPTGDKVLDDLTDTVFGEDGLVPTVVDSVVGIADGLLGEDGLVPNVVDSVVGTADGLLGEDGLVPNVVNDLVGALLGGEDGLVPTVLEVPLDLVGSLTDSLLGDGEDSGLGTTVLAAPLKMVDGLTDALLGNGEDSGLLEGTLDTVSNLTGGLLSVAGSPTETTSQADLLNTEPTTANETASRITGTVDDAVDAVSTTLNKLQGSDEAPDEAAAQSSTAYSSEAGTIEEATAELAAGAEPASTSTFFEESPNIFEAAANAVLQITENVAASITPTIPFVGQPTIDTDDYGDAGDPNGTLHHEAV